MSTAIFDAATTTCASVQLDNESQMQEWMTEEGCSLFGIEHDFRSGRSLGRRLHKGVVHQAVLVNVRLTGAIFYRADLQSADLTGADLTDADLVRANLDGAVLRSARLDSADMTNASVQGVDASGASDSIFSDGDWIWRGDLCFCILCAAAGHISCACERKTIFGARREETELRGLAQKVQDGLTAGNNFPA